MKKRVSFLAALALVLCGLTGIVHAEQPEIQVDPDAPRQEIFQDLAAESLIREEPDLAGPSAGYGRNPHSAYAEQFLYPETRQLYYALVEELDRVFHEGGTVELELPQGHPFRINYLRNHYGQIDRDVTHNLQWVLSEEHPELDFWVDYISFDRYSRDSMKVSVMVKSKYQYCSDEPMRLNHMHKDVVHARSSEDQIRSFGASLRGNTGLSAKQRLEKIRDYICANASYDKKNTSSTSYLPPHVQMWNVFDGNAGTSLVCAGYAELFQHLTCLVTRPEDNMLVFYVRGVTTGNHAWNVVRLNGGNYLVDMTAVDASDQGPYNGYFLHNQDKNWGEKVAYWIEVTPGKTYRTARDFYSSKYTNMYISAGRRSVYNDSDSPYAQSVYQLGNRVSVNFPDYSHEEPLGWSADGERYRLQNGYYATGRVELDGKLYFFSENGKRVLNGICYYNNEIYYIDANGDFLVGYQTIDGHSYYFYEDGTAARDEWVGDRYYGHDARWIPDYDPVTKSQYHWVYKYNDWYCEKKNGEKALYRWMPDSTGWCHLNANGTLEKNRSALCNTNGKEYYLDETGHASANQWTMVYDSRGNVPLYLRYFGSDGQIVKNQWVMDSIGWGYADAEGGKTVNTWKMDSDGWCYLNENGYMAVNVWALDSEGWHYMDESGHLTTNNWAQDSEGWYYMDGSGCIATNQWVLDSIGWCYVDGNGRILTSTWTMDSDGWCYVDGNGHMVTNGWTMDSNGWHYMDASGHMMTDNWAQDSEGWHYMDGSGNLAVNRWVADSMGWCYVDGNGKMLTNHWAMDANGWCYLDAGGHITVDSWIRDSVDWCYVDADGYMVTDRWLMDSSGWCYMGSDGHALRNAWMLDTIGWCYLDANGHMVTDGWAEDSSGWQYLDSTGHLAA